MTGPQCDRCAAAASEYPLRRFEILVHQAHASYGPMIDLCDDCEAQFLAAIESTIGETDARELRRDDEPSEGQLHDRSL